MKQRAFPVLLALLSENSLRVSKSTITDYYTTLKKVDRYYPKLRLSDINRLWINDLDQRMRQDGLAPNTVWKHHKNIKILISRMHDDGIIPLNPYARFPMKQHQNTRIVLSEDEIAHLESIQPPGELITARDIFLLSYYTLLRRSDLMRLKSKMIDGRTIRLTTQKTGKVVVIPVNNKLRAVLERFNGDDISDTQLNNNLKKLFQWAGLDRVIEAVKYENRNGSVEREFRDVMLCDVITVHCARRTGITHMVRAGVPTRMIMGLSGHSTETALMQYIGISPEENAELLLNHKYFSE